MKILLMSLILCLSFTATVLGQSAYNLKVIAQTGTEFGDTGTITNLGWGPSINDEGEVAFTGQIQPPEQGPDTRIEGVFVSNGGPIERRTALVNSVEYRLGSWVNYLDTAFSFGEVTQINNNGEIVYRVRARDGLFSFILRLGLTSNDLKIVAKNHYPRPDNPGIQAESPFFSLPIYADGLLPEVSINNNPLNNEGQVVFSGVSKLCNGGINQNNSCSIDAECPDAYCVPSSARVLSTPKDILADEHDLAEDFYFAAPISGSPVFFPIVSDDNYIVVRGGAKPTAPLTLFTDETLSTAIFIAATNIPEAISNDFNAIGQRPGISDDGRIVAFAADHTTDGVGIYVSIRIQLDPNTATYSVPEKIVGGASGLSAFDLNSRVGVNRSNRDSSTFYTIAFLAKRPADFPWIDPDPLGLYTTEIQINSDGLVNAYNPHLVLEQGQTVSEMSEEIKDIKLYDPINNKGQLAFWVSTDTEEAIVYAKEKKKFMLTFDDGPLDPMTGNILNQLSGFNVDGKPVKAGFFMVGNYETGEYLPLWDWERNKGSIRKHESVANRVGADHIVGNHTQHHAHFKKWKNPPFDSMESFIKYEIDQCEEEIIDIVGNSKKIFRPPYLQHTDDDESFANAIKDTVDGLNFEIIGGGIADCADVIRDPWFNIPIPIPWCTIEATKKKAKAILDSWQEDEPRVLIFHDNRRITYEHIKEIIEYLTEDEGYALVHFNPDRVGEEQDTNQAVSGAANSPVDLHIIDPDGLILNKQVNQIPASIYEEVDMDDDGELEDFFVIPEPKTGNYQIKVIPEAGASPEDVYSLGIEDGYKLIVLAEDTPINEIPEKFYSFKVKKSGIEEIASVPDVVGLNQADAVSTLSAIGLNVGSISEKSSDTVPADHVVSQEPVAGTEVAKGSEVNLVVSSGSEPVICGDFDGNGAVTYDDLYNIFIPAYGTRTGDSGYVAECDLNQDESIDMLDYSEWYVCYMNANP